jgi:hypothetical protein
MLTKRIEHLLSRPGAGHHERFSARSIVAGGLCGLKTAGGRREADDSLPGHHRLGGGRTPAQGWLYAATRVAASMPYYPARQAVARAPFPETKSLSDLNHCIEPYISFPGGSFHARNRPVGHWRSINERKVLWSAMGSPDTVKRD